MRTMAVVARLAPDATLDQARVEMNGIAARLARAYPATNQDYAAIQIETFQDRFNGGQVRPVFLAMMGAVGFVLLIACANVANLLLSRSVHRAREVAVRIALGATRWRVIRQLLVESVLLGCLGGVAGLGLAAIGVRLFDRAVAETGKPYWIVFSMDYVVFAFLAAICLFTGVLFGLAPALQASRSRGPVSLRESGRSISGGSSRAARRTLVVLEVAVALVLLVGGGLLMRTLLRLQAVDLGFDPRGVLVGQVLPPQPKYPNGAARIAFYDRLLERVAAIPGAERAALSSVIPLGGDSDMDLLVEGRPIPQSAADATTTWYRVVSAGYLQAMGIPLRNGRHIAPGEAAPVVVVSETAARRFWPGENPLGRRVRFSPRPDAPWFTVIGVAGDVRMQGAREGGRTEMYLPYWHVPEPGTNVVLKAQGSPLHLAAALRSAVREIDPDLPVSGVEAMDAIAARSIAEPRFRRAGAGARGHRHLRRAVVRGGHADERNRRADGARRRALAGVPAGGGRRAGAGVRRRAPRGRRRVRAQPRPGCAPLRDCPRRPCDVRRHGGRRARRGAARGGAAGPTRHARRSGGRAARGLAEAPTGILSGNRTTGRPFSAAREHGVE
jgi:putative ABC transport system permease protein